MSVIKKGVGTFQGRVLEVAFHGSGHIEWTGLGCHSLAVQHLGRIVVGGMRWGALSEGTIYDDGQLATFPFSIRNIPPTWALTPQAVQDVVYSRLLQTFVNKGVIIFSDRVNRGTPASPAKLQEGIGPLVFSCAALAMWITKHPEVGSIYASPFLNNPNYRASMSYGICQVWMYFPPGVNMFTDETLGPIGPDVRLSRENFVSRGSFYQNTLNGAAVYRSGIPAGYDKITYDGG